MNRADLIPLLPLLVIACTSVVIMLLLAVARSHAATAASSVIGLGVAGAIAPLAAGPGPRQITSLLVVDDYSLFYICLICAAGVAISALAHDYWRRRSKLPEEFYLLLLLAVLGAAVLVSSIHFASLFLGLETLSLSLYAMIAYRRTDRNCIEAGIKYLILAALSAAFLLFGMALVYMEVGSMEFSVLADHPASSTGILAAGVCLMVVGLGFKLALVPFHLWTPDVYEGAPVPTLAFVATISKGAVFALLIRFFALGGFLEWSQMKWLLAAVAAASMFAGNLLALQQANIKRILAYSSIAHMGYLTVALVVGGTTGVAASAFYLVAYFVSIIGACGVMAVLSGDQRDADQELEYYGLASQRPWLAAVMSGMLFSLAGLPLTAGFVGKFYILVSGVGASRWSLVILLVLNSSIGLYYYLRVIVAMYRSPESLPGEAIELGPLVLRRVRSLASGATLSVLCLSLVWLGVYPTPLIRAVESIALGLVN